MLLGCSSLDETKFSSKLKKLIFRHRIRIYPDAKEEEKKDILEEIRRKVEPNILHTKPVCRSYQ